jgi:putative glycosyltransferase (TIGR04348 family)
MKIALVTPSAATRRTGNRHTAQRYAAFLRGAGHKVRALSRWDGTDCDLMIALHARKSADSIAQFRARFPVRPLVVVLTGTDLYRDIRSDLSAQASLEAATLLITLQELGKYELPQHLRGKARTVYQSAARVARHGRGPRTAFRICVLGHLREEKDPFRVAFALRLLPDLRLEVVHAGDALSPDLAEHARDLMRGDARYRWIGGVSHPKALEWLAASHLMVLSSRMEGGANVICEAARAGIPILASRISGNVGMLGRSYPGYYPLADEHALARLIRRASSEREFYRRLTVATAKRRHLFSPAAECRGLRAVVGQAVRIAAKADLT